MVTTPNFLTTSLCFLSEVGGLLGHVQREGSEPRLPSRSTEARAAPWVVIAPSREVCKRPVAFCLQRLFLNQVDPEILCPRRSRGSRGSRKAGRGGSLSTVLNTCGSPVLLLFPICDSQKPQLWGPCFCFVFCAVWVPAFLSVCIKVFRVRSHLL